MRADLYFDPACPWTWITSRWLDEVRQHRALDLRLRPFSLLLDDTLADIPLARRLELAGSTRVLRLMEAARARHGDRIVDELYTRVGIAFHHDGHRGFETLDQILIALDLDPRLLEALDDPSWDRVIEISMLDAHELAGRDAGTPLLSIEGDGPRRAFLGPVFSPAPTGLAALSAWDGLVTLIAAPGFFELKRHLVGDPVLPRRPDSVVVGAAPEPSSGTTIDLT